MAGALRKTMLYLGLTEDDDRYDAYEETTQATRRDQRDSARPARAGEESSVREAHPVRESAEPRESRVHGAHAATALREVEPEPQRHAEVTQLPRRTPVAQVVNDVEVSGVHRITTIHPRTYNEAKNIGENFREGTPVIMNLTDLDDADAKRLVDFAAGLVFGLQGSIERVTAKVFLLSPADVEVTTEGGEPVKGRGLFNQS